MRGRARRRLRSSASAGSRYGYWATPQPREQRDHRGHGQDARAARDPPRQQRRSPRRRRAPESRTNGSPSRSEAVKHERRVAAQDEQAGDGDQRRWRRRCRSPAAGSSARAPRPVSGARRTPGTPPPGTPRTAPPARRPGSTSDRARPNGSAPDRRPHPTRRDGAEARRPGRTASRTDDRANTAPNAPAAGQGPGRLAKHERRSRAARCRRRPGHRQNSVDMIEANAARERRPQHDQREDQPDVVRLPHRRHRVVDQRARPGAAPRAARRSDPRSRRRSRPRRRPRRR